MSEEPNNEWPLAFVLVGLAFALVALVWVLSNAGVCK